MMTNRFHSDDALRALKVLVAILSLSALASCSEYPFDPWRRPTGHVQSCVSGDTYPRDGNLPVCDDDLDDDEEEDRDHEKKNAQPVRPE